MIPHLNFLEWSGVILWIGIVVAIILIIAGIRKAAHNEYLDKDPQNQ